MKKHISKKGFLKKDNSKIVKAIKIIDFGDIDGLYDSKLNDYFIDNNYWKSIIDSNKYFVIGRKGTGKSALYNWIQSKQYEKGLIISNLSFRDFPFEKLLALNDETFAKPNQYQSIWRNIIYTEICKMIIKDQKNPIDEIFIEIRKYVEYVFGEDLTELHKQITRQAEKSERGIKLLFKSMFGYEGKTSLEKTLDLSADSLDNISLINKKLEEYIFKYLLINNKTKYIIQFDQLDDNYTQYSNKADYFQCIISLFKAVYDINQSMRKLKINVQNIVYLRSDIYNSIDAFDSESARWDQFKFNLSWAIINKTDWKNPLLLNLINARIWATFKSLNEKDAFKLIFNHGMSLEDRGHKEDVFKYLVHRSFHRPRDIIQFSIKIQEEVLKSNEYYFRSIKNAEKEYSLWLLSEVANEIAPKINDLNKLYELLRLMGRNIFSISDFRRRYHRYKEIIKLDDDELLHILYSFGIITNIQENKFNKREFYSIIRNDRSVFNRDLKIEIHPGFSEGLYTSKFLKR